MKDSNTLSNIKTAIRIILTLGGIILGIWLIIKLGAYFLPFVIGWLIALLAGPLVRLLENKLKIKPGAGSVIITVLVLFIVCAIIYFSGAALVNKGNDLMHKLPDYYRSVTKELETAGNKLAAGSGIVSEKLGDAITKGLGSVKNSVENSLNGMGQNVLNTVGKIVDGLPYAFICVIVVIFSAYYFMANRGSLKKTLDKLFPGNVGERIRFIGGELKKGVGGYFKAQLIIMVVIFAILAIAFALLKVSFGPLWAFLIALLDFLPFFGTGFVLIPWAFVKILNGGYKMAIILCALYIVCLVVHQMLQPWLLSDKMEINPLLTLVFMFTGYKIGGVLGIFLGLIIGMVLVDMYQAGAFANLLGDCKSLIKNIGKWLRKA